VAAGSIAASTALADAGIDMIGLVVSCSGVSVFSRCVSFPRRQQPAYKVDCRDRYMAGSNAEGNASIKRCIGSLVYPCAGDCH